MKQFLRQTLNWKRDNTSGRDKAGSMPAESRSYAAVAILPGLIACDAVAKFGGCRMLEKDAPSLPVEGCDEARCRCRYVKFGDRRSGEDRRAPFASLQLDTLRMSCEEMRTRSDRRNAGKSNSRERAKPRSYFNNYD